MDRNNLEFRGVSWVGRGIVLKFVLKKYFGGSEWINVTQNHDNWRAFVVTVMKILVP